MQEDEYVIYFKFCYIIFIMDILIKLNTGFLEKGNVITSRFKIACNYFKKFLLLDLLAILPFFKFYVNMKLQN